MDLRLLGPVEASTKGRSIELGARKQRAVLAMLALEVGRTVSADRLAEGLWGEEPPSSAPKMVQLYVSRLRRLLDGNGALIVTRGRGYELQLSGGAVDAVTAERLLDQSRARDAGVSRGDGVTVAGSTSSCLRRRHLGSIGVQRALRVRTLLASRPAARSSIRRARSRSS